MAIRSEPLPLPQLLPAAARGFAVLDLETTGTGQLCRIVEIAVLLLSPDGELPQEWTTLIDPGVPIPNAAVHGTDDALAARAASFAKVGPGLLALLEGHVLVARNLDCGCLPGSIHDPILRQYLREASSCNQELVVGLGDGINNLPDPVASLGKLCDARRITLIQIEAHTALGDTSAVAASGQNSSEAKPGTVARVRGVRWPVIRGRGLGRRARQTPPSRFSTGGLIPAPLWPAGAAALGDQFAAQLL
jgi:hypothetical protein